MEREEAIFTLKEIVKNAYWPWYQEAIDMAIEALSNQQKWIDEELQNYVIEHADLVTCKDCKHYEWADNRAFGMPTKRCEWTGFEDVDDNDFCSRAERREP